LEIKRVGLMVLQRTPSPPGDHRGHFIQVFGIDEQICLEFIVRAHRKGLDSFAHIPHEFLVNSAEGHQIDAPVITSPDKRTDGLAASRDSKCLTPTVGLSIEAPITGKHREETERHKTGSRDIATASAPTKRSRKAAKASQLTTVALGGTGRGRRRRRDAITMQPPYAAF
jgi:hypothetical protein